MKISKTNLKNFSNCESYPALYNIKRDKLRAFEETIGIPLEEIYEILGNIFDPESGEDLTAIDTTQLEAMAEKYKDVEELAIKFCEDVFQTKIKASRNINEQEKVEYFKDGHTFYTYLDGFKETDNEFLIFEVKATTNSEFLKLEGKVGLDKIPYFNKEGNFLVPNEHHERMWETEKKLLDRYSDTGKYFFDIAITDYLFKHSNLFINNKKKKVRSYLVILNSDYVYDGVSKGYPELNGEKLFNIIDTTYIIEDYDIEEEINKTIKYINEANTDCIVSKKCRRKKTDCCPMVNYCWKEPGADGSIFEYLYNHFGFKRGKEKAISTFDLYYQYKYFKMVDVPDELLNRPINKVQKACALNNEEYINIKNIKTVLGKLRYPLYHLDFESFNDPLPRFRGENPYSQSVFQYSLHIEKEPGDKNVLKNHTQYIAKGFGDERYELVKQLVNDIKITDKKGMVVVYNKAFEESRLKEFIVLFPEFEEKLQLMIDNMVDLLKILNSDSYMSGSIDQSRGGSMFNYYNVDLHGSFSIKKVLPVFSDLSYKDLAVKNGMEAILAYSKFEHGTKEEIEDIRNNLAIYCGQDTYSMVVILNKLWERVRKGK